MNNGRFAVIIPVIANVAVVNTDATCFQFFFSSCFAISVITRIIVMISIPIAATFPQSTISADVSLYISVARVVPPSWNDADTESCANSPNTIIVAADSPITLPTPRTVPEIICGAA